MTENEEKRLQNIRKKMAQFKAQEKTMLTRDKKRQRKERTRRLIQYGIMVEKYFDKNFSVKEIEETIKRFTKMP